MAAANPLPPLLQAGAGAFGSAVSNALVFPLDVVTKRMQTQGRKGGYKSPQQAIRNILAAEGIVGLYKGLAADTLSTLLSNFLYFFAYSFFRKRLALRKAARGFTDKFTALEELAIGVVAGILSRAVITPLSQITVRQQTAANPAENAKAVEDAGDDSDDEDGGYSAPTILEVGRQIYDERGITGFWSGFDSTCILTLNPSITLYLFELFKRLTIPRAYRDKPTPSQTFLTSAMASSLAAVITYPLSLAKTRQQWRAPDGRRVYGGMLDIWRKTVRKQGVQGLFSGLQAQVVKSFLQLGTTMTVKQRIELVVVLAYQRYGTGNLVARA